MPDRIVLTVPKSAQSHFEHFLKDYALDIDLKTHDRNDILCGVRAFSLPVRVGHVLNYLRSLSEKPTATQVRIGPNTLDLVNMQFQTQGGTVKILTEKERDILYVLSGCEDGLSRAALLEKIWGYDHNIETHTLETHIYRLRQKIEFDPGNPALLVTTPEGYKIDHV